jgi:hypothetical protein
MVESAPDALDTRAALHYEYYTTVNSRSPAGNNSKHRHGSLKVPTVGSSRGHRPRGFPPYVLNSGDNDIYSISRREKKYGISKEADSSESEP